MSRPPHAACKARAERDDEVRAQWDDRSSRQRPLQFGAPPALSAMLRQRHVACLIIQKANQQRRLTAQARRRIDHERYEYTPG